MATAARDKRGSGLDGWKSNVPFAQVQILCISDGQLSQSNGRCNWYD
jgi:hypothetical protein